MTTSRNSLNSRHLLAIAAATLVCGCVQDFSGAVIQGNLGGSVHVPGRGGGAAPPVRTHYELYGVRHDVLAGQDVATVFKLVAFEVLPAVDLESPCFIELEEQRFPGLHATRELEKLQEVTGIEDPFAAPADASQEDLIALVGAQNRRREQTLLASGLKAIVGHSPTPPPAIAADCGDEDPRLVPPPHCIDDASNEKRLDLCLAFFQAHTDYYVGSDRQLTLPLNGIWFGTVDGSDPRNGLPMGGFGIAVPADMGKVGSVLVNWQYDCHPAEFESKGHDCEPLVPDGFEDGSPIGYHYLSGSATEVTRSVMNVPLRNRLFAELRGELAIFADLDRDNTSF